MHRYLNEVAKNQRKSRCHFLLLMQLYKIKELVSMDLAEYDPVKANKILECADSKFGRWAFSEVDPFNRHDVYLVLIVVFRKKR